jgi:DnaA regulatory inactivator Hda
MKIQRRTSLRTLPESQQYILDLPYRKALDRQDFIVGDSNLEAVSWIDRWPAWPEAALIIVGPAGSGKSHLAAVWQQKTAAVSVQPGWARRAIADIANEFSGRALLIDCLEDFVQSRSGETFLFHLINYARSEQANLLFLSQTPPAHLQLELNDLRSRLLAMSTVPIVQPDDDLVHGLYAKLFADRQLKVSGEVVNYLLAHANRDFPAIQKLVASLDALSLSKKRAVTVPLVKSVLADLN